MTPEARSRLFLGPRPTSAAISTRCGRYRRGAVRGDAALSEFARQFDGAPVPARHPGGRGGDRARLRQRAGELAKAILYARDNILRYHQTQLPKPMMLTPVAAGVLAGERWGPIPSVACYVPRGKGSFPSVCLMTLIPAVVAKVPRIVLITPPGPDGRVDDATLFVARAVGVTEIYKCGGAQAVAAVAYGTATVPKCDKIVGPGSPWVVAAKQLLSRQIDPGPPAGPSEAIVLADSTANAWKAALDLVDESEHGPDRRPSWSRPDARIADSGRRLRAEDLGAPVGGPPRVLAGGADRQARRRGAVPRHGGGRRLHQRVRRRAPAGALGRPVPLRGAAGQRRRNPARRACRHLPRELRARPNAVLPTAGAAQTASPLSVYDYLKRTSLVHVTEAGYPPLAKAAHTLAEYEGFDGHAWPSRRGATRRRNERTDADGR